ncbi:hypothetical protein [Euzebyella saccharophila]|uniref:Lipocalin-like domain-containing protein n=1 Tax=Euzebyella saccharophila TaxID=679664 RepID=A0ABV8JNW9_9FLAO|nr:hypothetical protein [Euzebyella saccharophila]
MMKTISNYIGIVLLITTVTISCSKDNDPTDDNLFVGTYDGTISYSELESETNITTEDGRVTVVKVGDNYRFDFSNGIPSINGITMEKNQNILINSSGSIKIDEGELLITYTEEGETWGADCTR